MKINKVLICTIAYILFFSALIPFVYANEDHSEVQIAMGNSTSRCNTEYRVRMDHSTKEVEVYISNSEESKGDLSYIVVKTTPYPPPFNAEGSKEFEGKVKTGKDIFLYIPSEPGSYIDLMLQSKNKDCKGFGTVTKIQEGTTIEKDPNKTIACPPWEDPTPPWLKK